LIDIHCHILSEVDDGSKNLEMSISMLKQAKENKVKYICVTPHFKKYNQKYLEKVAKKYIELRNIAKDMGIKLFLGSEIMYSHNTVKDLKRALIPSINNTKYTLIEFPVYLDSKSIFDALYSLIAAGYLPILAHVERYQELNLDKVKELVDLGVVIQVNCKTITLGRLNKTYRYITNLINNNLVHVISSDAHNTSSRQFMNVKAAKIIENKYGSKTKDKLFRDNLLKILKGEKLWL